MERRDSKIRYATIRHYKKIENMSKDIEHCEICLEEQGIFVALEDGVCPVCGNRSEEDIGCNI